MIDFTDPRVQAAVETVLDAWTVAGPHPDYHRSAQIRLGKDWPRLANALNILEEMTS